MDFADYFWLAWLAVIAVADIIMATVFKKRRWTFSHHVWEWFAIGKNWKEDYAGLRWFILMGLLVSLILHFNFGLGTFWSIIYHYRRER
jgi:hypothetical protein